MVYEYYEVTKDKDFITKMIPILEKELNFWNTNRMTTVEINGETHAVYQYNSRSNMPRPEAYTQDLKKALKVHYKAEYWQGLASAAESGWDFSTRWFSDRKLIYAVETKNVLPVDLNAFMCWNFDILTYLYERIDDPVKSEFYRERRAKFRKTVHKVFYNQTAGSWFDFNTRTGLHNQAFYPSIAVPLFTGCYNTLNQGKSERLFTLMKVESLCRPIFVRFQHIGVFEYPGGIPTSMVTSSEEQWDFPNGFSPMNHMIVEGLRKSHNAQMQDERVVVIDQNYSLQKGDRRIISFRLNKCNKFFNL
ncbi:unnamed protein product [Cylicostephanus goldi]|uniref:Trehalase n=1 Tax=Cylicostephanus goldi TaxID=71465 RepID=A0A3P6R030_CYLGO|nr:unnamed protein product [Cylicostephanus goldi]